MQTGCKHIKSFKPIVKATLIIILFTGITRALGFAYRIYLVNVIDAESLGIYQIALSVFTVLVTITSSGVPVTVSRTSAKYRAVNDYKSANGAVMSAAAFMFVLACVFSILILIFKNLFSFVFTEQRCLPIFLSLIPAFIASSIYSAFRGGLWGQKAFVAYSVTELLEEIILILFGIILTLSVDSVFEKTLSAAAAISISYCVAAVIAVIIYIRRGGKFSKFNNQLKPLLTNSAPVTGARLMSAILTSVIALILPLQLTMYGLTKSQALAEFGIVTGMTLPLLFLPGAIVGSLALVLVPEISHHNELKNQAELKKRIEGALNFAVAVSLIIIPAFVACGKELCTFLYKNEKSGEYLQAFAFMMLPMSLNNIASSVLNSLGKEYKALRNYCIGAITLVLCIFILPQFIGVYALLVGYILNLLITAALNIICINKHIKISFKFLLNTVILLVIAAPVIFFGYNLQSIFNLLKAPTFVSIAVMLVCMASIVLVSVIFKILDFSMIFKKRESK